MMKKFLIALFSLVSILALTGYGGRVTSGAENLLKSQAPIKKSYRQKKSIAKQRRQNGSLGRLK